MAGIKSRPVYQPLALDGSGVRHLLLVGGAQLPEETALPAAVETWLVAAHSRAIPGRLDHDEATPTRLAFRSTAQMLARLAQRLRTERMGLRLYAVGEEDFLWDVNNVAAEAGLGRQEVRLTHAGSLRRRVICVHCGTRTEGVTTNIAVCAGCGARLFVRDHFSRRLAGFMGVQADAEVPGELPEIVESYR